MDLAVLYEHLKKEKATHADNLKLIESEEKKIASFPRLINPILLHYARGWARRLILNRPASLDQRLAPIQICKPCDGHSCIERYTMETDDGDRFDLTGKIVIRGRAPEFIGSYSVVYRGQWAENAVAVKIIRSVGALSTMRRKVCRERMVWESLEHPNILPFYGHADDEEFQPFGAFISPWCLNGDVGRFLERSGGEMETAARVVLWTGVLNGVAFLHSRTPVIVHGDLKPGNILIDDDRNPRICDFGLSRIIQETGTGGMTTTTEHTGTERYLAPELATDTLPAPTTESDVYALGCLGLEFIYLERPYAHRQNNHHGCIIADIREGIPPASRQDDVHSPMDVWWGTLRSWDLLEAFWSLDPEGRPAAAFLMGSLAASNDSLGNAHIERGVTMRHYDTPVESRYRSMSDQERLVLPSGSELAELAPAVDSLGFRFALDRPESSQQYTSSSRQLPVTPDARKFPAWMKGENRDLSSIEGTSGSQSSSDHSPADSGVHRPGWDKDVMTDIEGLKRWRRKVTIPWGMIPGQEVRSPVRLEQPGSISDSSLSGRRARRSPAEDSDHASLTLSDIELLSSSPSPSPPASPLEVLQFSGRVSDPPTDSLTPNPQPLASRRAAPDEGRTYRPPTLHWDNLASALGRLALSPPVPYVRSSSSFQFTVRGDLEGGLIDQRTVENARQTPQDGEAKRVPPKKAKPTKLHFLKGFTYPVSIKPLPPAPAPPH